MAKICDSLFDGSICDRGRFTMGFMSSAPPPLVSIQRVVAMPTGPSSAYIEVYYRHPMDDEREKRISSVASRYGGAFHSRDLPSEHRQSVVVWFEFPTYDGADQAANAIRDDLGEHVEGPGEW